MFAIGNPIQQRPAGFGGGAQVGMQPRGVGDPPRSVGPMQSFKKGGKVKRTGLAKVHKDERVLTKKEQKHDLKASAKKRMR